MKTSKQHILPLILFMLCLLSSIIIAPTTQAATNNKDIPYVIDDANLLSTDDQQDLNDLANKYSKKHNTSIVVVTTNDTNNLSTTDYASMYYDTYIHGNDGYNDNCVLFLIDIDNHKTNIFAYEDAAIRMDSGRSNKILDVVTPKLKEVIMMTQLKLSSKRLTCILVQNLVQIQITSSLSYGFNS